MNWMFRPSVSDRWPYDVLEAGPAPEPARRRAPGYLVWTLALVAAFAFGAMAEPMAEVIVHTSPEAVTFGSSGADDLPISVMPI